MTPSHPPRVRYDAIDVARGTAMVLVCLSHFGAMLWSHPDTRDVGTLLTRLAFVASPTFALISGAVPGLLRETAPERFRGLRYKLIDRAVFLLLVAHPLLALAELPKGNTQALWAAFITDAIAIDLFFGPWMVERLAVRRRVAVALTVYAASWGMVLLWHPEAHGALLFKNYVFGLVAPDPAVPRQATFPIAPWVAVYVLGGVMGTLIGRHVRSGDERAAARVLERTGIAAALAVLLCKGALIGARLAGRESDVLRHALYPLVNPMQKVPAGPFYLLLWGGLGILLVARIMMLDGAAWAAPVMQPLRELGRASLVVFVGQAYVYYVLLHALDTATQQRWPHFLHVAWPALFPASLLVLLSVARAWNRMNGNRWLGVGLEPLLERRAAGAGDVPAWRRWIPWPAHGDPL